MTHSTELEEMLQRLRTGPRRTPVSAGAVGTSRYKRAVGYCEDTDCEDYAKGVFLLSHGPIFSCPRCRREGTVMPETGSYTSVSDIFKEVRIEYNFDPISRRYRELAIVRDDSLMGTHNVYTLESPLIKTEKRALKVAESLLANLNSSTSLLDLLEGRLPRTSEFVLDIDQDRETFNRQLAILGKRLEESNLSHHRR